MQEGLKNIASADLIQRLRKNSEYFMLLCKTGTDPGQRKVVQEYIDLIIAELKARNVYMDLLDNEPTSMPSDKSAC